MTEESATIPPENRPPLGQSDPSGRQPRPVTVPVRVPDYIYADLRRWAQLQGKTPGDIMADAWNEWVAAHKDEILADLDKLRAEVERA